MWGHMVRRQEYSSFPEFNVVMVGVCVGVRVYTCMLVKLEGIVTLKTK